MTGGRGARTPLFAFRSVRVSRVGCRSGGPLPPRRPRGPSQVAPSAACDDLGSIHGAKQQCPQLLASARRRPAKPSSRSTCSTSSALCAWRGSRGRVAMRLQPALAAFIESALASETAPAGAFVRDPQRRERPLGSAVHWSRRPGARRRARVRCRCARIDVDMTPTTLLIALVPIHVVTSTARASGTAAPLPTMRVQARWSPP